MKYLQMAFGRNDLAGVLLPLSGRGRSCVLVDNRRMGNREGAIELLVCAAAAFVGVWRPIPAAAATNEHRPHRADAGSRVRVRMICSPVVANRYF